MRYQNSPEEFIDHVDPIGCLCQNEIIMKNAVNYLNRIVFFFDILGFRDLIETNEREKGSNCTTIYDVFKFINSFYRDEIDSRYSETKQITFFSDSIIISFVVDDRYEIFKTVADIQNLLVNLVLKGIVMRGAISYGKLFHDENFLFGPAFIEAYKIESKEAKYPRIICEGSIVLMSLKNQSFESARQDFETVHEILKQDDDKFWYIDYFEGIESLFDDGCDYIDYLLKLKNLIVKNIQTAATADILQKYLWMKEKFNQTAMQIIEKNVKSGSLTDYVVVKCIEQLSLI